MNWNKHELINYIKDIEYHKNKIRVIDIKIGSLELTDKERKKFIHKRDEFQNILDQVESCINNLNDEDRVILITNIKEGIPLKSLQLNYSLNSLSRRKNIILKKIIETLNV